MMDVVEKNGDQIDIQKLGKALGCEIITISALKNMNTMQAAELCIHVAKEHIHKSLPAVFTGSVEHAIAHIEESIEDLVPASEVRWFAIKAFERDEKALENSGITKEILDHIESHIADCEREEDDDAESIITNQRYNYITNLIAKTVKKGKKAGELTLSDKIDRIVTNRFLALPIFAGVMFLVYYIAVTTIGTRMTDWTNDVLFWEWLEGGTRSLM